MKKWHYLTLNLLTSITVSIMFFMCSYYPRHIIENISSSGMWEIFFNFVFFIIYAAFLIIAFSQNRHFFCHNSSDIHERKKSVFILKILILFVLQLLYDIVLLSLNNASLLWKYIGVDFLLVLYWIPVYLVIAERNSAIWNSAKRLFCIVGVFLAVLLFSIVWDFYVLNDYSILLQKYNENSPYLMRVVQNLNFLHSIKALIADIILVSSLVVIHSFGLKIYKAYPNNKKESYKDGNTAKEAFQIFICSDFIIAIVILIMVLKMAILPNSTFVFSYNTTSQSAFSDNDYSTVETVDRFRGFKDDNSIPIYSKQKVTIQKSDTEIEIFNFNSAEPDCVLGDKFTKGADSFEYTFGSDKLYVYGNYAVHLIENGEPKIIRIENLSECEKNEALTSLLKDLIVNGNFFAFEYGAEYLIKYDYDFIRPYIERYSMGQFTEFELEWLESSYYRMDYAVHIAKSYLN